MLNHMLYLKNHIYDGLLNVFPNITNSN